MISILDGRAQSLEQTLTKLSRRSQLSPGAEKQAVEEIVKGVLEGGDGALLRYTKTYDQVSFASAEEMEVTPEEYEEAEAQISPQMAGILRKSMDRILRFHEKQRQNSWITLEEDGMLLGQRITAIERVGVYVPGGRAAYPSSVLMNVLPAVAAGVDEIIMVTPPKAGGKVNPAVLAAARLAGVHRVFKAGGAQAVAALAFGTAVIPKVDKIVGPGNIYVTLAKKEVYGYVDIDMIAGPSEVLILADNSAEAHWVAADMLSQAEHDPLASAILITDSERLASEVQRALTVQAEAMTTREVILSSLQNYGAIILTENLQQAAALSNRIAPEHLELAVAAPYELLNCIRHAGAVFLGHYAPEPLGDYMAGPNHVLPTSGTARFFSPLGVDDFVKKSSLISCTPSALRGLYQDVAAFARAEGLPAHAHAVEVRFDKG